MVNNIKMIIMDVDGTLTDGKVYIGNDGEIMKAFSVKDGLRIKQLEKHRITPVIITGRRSNIVDIRAKEINIKEVYQSIEDKSMILNKIMSNYDINKENVAYIGDDENDIECMIHCGLTGCPSNADIAVLRIADYICKNKGGDGAVREFIDYILKIQT